MKRRYKQPPVIVKWVKRQERGHHPLTWKVAYADFVTAMMAFFLLLWLLDTTTPEQKKGLARYFTPTMGIMSANGIGVRGGKVPDEEGTSRTDLSAPGLVLGQAQYGPIPMMPLDIIARYIDQEAESTSLDNKIKEEEVRYGAVAHDIRQALERDPALKEHQKNIAIFDSVEGLNIDLTDDEEGRVFKSGGVALTANGKKLLNTMFRIIANTPNHLSITGMMPPGEEPPDALYGNWELAADRAHAVRRYALAFGLEEERIKTVAGSVTPENNSPEKIRLLLVRGSYVQSRHSSPVSLSQPQESSPAQPLWQLKKEQSQPVRLSPYLQ